MLGLSRKQHFFKALGECDGVYSLDQRVRPRPELLHIDKDIRLDGNESMAYVLRPCLLVLISNLTAKLSTG